ncbi:hypothetical protein PMV_268 [Port-miou virus]|uniref:DUF5869 domain-containing protein n=1 Tax=Port-miou virus TaxID=1733873 RepID=A0A0N9P6X5_9VIRU|nr:hypothetical protein PMV_268 [Port-miou virus]
MQKISEWPIEWQEILLCTKHWQYNGECEVWHKTTPYFSFLEKEEQWVTFSHHFGITSLGPQTVPAMYQMYLFGEKVVCQFEERGHWFVFSDKHMNSSRCSTCDGKTKTSCEVTECFSLHDMVWFAMDEREREKLEIYSDSETFSEFRKKIKKTQLKKKLFS